MRLRSRTLFRLSYEKLTAGFLLSPQGSLEQSALRGAFSLIPELQSAVTRVPLLSLRAHQECSSAVRRNMADIDIDCIVDYVFDYTRPREEGRLEPAIAGYTTGATLSICMRVQDSRDYAARR